MGSTPIARTIMPVILIARDSVEAYVGRLEENGYEVTGCIVAEWLYANTSYRIAKTFLLTWSKNGANRSSNLPDT